MPPSKARRTGARRARPGFRCSPRWPSGSSEHVCRIEVIEQPARRCVLHICCVLSCAPDVSRKSDADIVRVDNNEQPAAQHHTSFNTSDLQKESGRNITWASVSRRSPVAMVGSCLCCEAVSGTRQRKMQHATVRSGTGAGGPGGIGVRDVTIRISGIGQFLFQRQVLPFRARACSRVTPPSSRMSPEPGFRTPLRLIPGYQQSRF